MDQISAKKRLLEITKRKFLDTLEKYYKLNEYKQKNGSFPSLDQELGRLQASMKKFSAKQKRFRQILVHREPVIDTTKELFLEALGLVTREASIKLKNKSTERKRRKTANPRYSHEAATKRQVSLLKKPDKKVKLPKQAIKHPPQASSEELMINEERELLAQRITLLSRISMLKEQIQKKRDRNESINKENERIRRRGLDIIAAVNLFSKNILFEEDIDMKCEETLDQLD